LEASGLRQASAADKQTLIRRATFDLIGLPPTPAEIEAFQADESSDAFTKVVDRLLASPQFGERWARHWLDVVRYAETLGHEFDYPIAEAWRYRDYVIRALNDDLPYDQFVREHVAGDLLDPPRRHPTEGFNESIIATAFWYLGEATHAPVDAQADQAIRLDNQVDVFSKAFLALTVACARCHDHKFDAISTEDYYALAGYAASSHQQVAPLDPGRQIEAGAKRLAELHERGRDLWRELPSQAASEAADYFARCLLAASDDAVSDAGAREQQSHRRNIDPGVLAGFMKAFDNPAAQEPGHPFFAWNALVRESARESFDARRRALQEKISERLAAGAHEKPGELFEDFSAGYDDWFSSGWAFGAGPTQVGDWTATPSGPSPLPIGVASSERLGAKLQGVLRSKTFTIEKPYVHYRISGRKGQIRLIVDGYYMDNFSPLLFEGLSFKVNADGETEWRVQNVSKFVGHRAHIELVDSGDGFVAVDEIWFCDLEAAEAPRSDIATLVLSQADIKSSESLAAAYGKVWAASLDDWRRGKPSAGANFVRWALAHNLTPVDSKRQAELAEASRHAAALDAALPAPERVVAIAEGSGDDQRIHLQGSSKNLGELVPRRFLDAIAGPNQPAPRRGSGRLKLAERLLSPDNPFPARVMVNRLWAHLFGRGLVASVDNFGALGEAPTHPELLDYLASRFRDGGWSIKRMIREIMLTEAYQRRSDGPLASDEQDPLNLLLHRANVRRLEGEAIRDAMLALSGKLDVTPFGPSVPIHLTSFMEGRGRPKENGPLDGYGRRSIYIETRRNFLAPAMLAFDFPVPASCIGRRYVSNVPAQALILMNDPFVLEQCRHWATRLLEPCERSTEKRVTQLYMAAFGRTPSSEELDAATAFIAKQAELYGAGQNDVRVWSDFCHVLVNVKEFIFLN
jgi:hypothetical protein